MLCEINNAKVYSGNEFLERTYIVTDAGGKVVAKPKLTGYWAGDTYELKPRSPRAKYTHIDDAMEKIFSPVLLGVKAGDPKSKMSTEAYQERLKQVKEYEKAVDKALQPIIRYVGCLGSLPEDIPAKTYTADELEAAKILNYPIPVALRDGTFFVVKPTQDSKDNFVVCVAPEVAWYDKKKM